ncbi:MAG TPA: hypothetical protein VE172_20100 [Stackebrandtia sp.]|jgi:hypothetical protein|uniref:hypothetical protein n=1 Tax=Stackebrandtia sp. TaxID=2023065 RepID=UPI002D59710E|nr:hypothetical protein [Stackebrandtia sp.]HZE41108.1 hypothetical protein [Stackebrandtia sp.]
MTFPKPEDLDKPETIIDQKSYRQDMTDKINHIIELVNKVNQKNADRQSHQK